MSNLKSDKKIDITYWGLQDYVSMWERMRQRHADPHADSDALWITEHLPVYTLGSQGGSEHILKPTSIPVIPTDRGGNVTYHGPGQLVIYPLIHLRRYPYPLRTFIDTLETALLEWIRLSIPQAHLIPDQRGIYINAEKIASMGLKIAQGKTYHGLSVNLSLSLEAFDNIHPCGYPNLKMTRWIEHAPFPKEWHLDLERIFIETFNYSIIHREYSHARHPLSQITWPGKTSTYSD